MNPFTLCRDSAFAKPPSNELHAAIFATLTEAAAGYVSGWSPPASKYAFVIAHFENRLGGKENPFVVTLRTMWANKK